WVIMGATSFVLLVPIAFVMYRQPEDIGLLPDGETPEEAARARAARASAGVREEYSFSVKEVIRMPTVWLLVAATVVVGPTPQGLTSSWVPHFRDIGIGAAAATTALSIYGLFSLLSRFVWGHFVDRYHVRRVLIVQMLMTSLAVLILIQVATPLQAMAYSAYQGFVLGGYIGMSPLLYPTYFGRRHVGAIQGTLTPLVSISSAGGPFLIATVFDLTGSYRDAYWVIMFTWLAAAALMYLARPPKPPAESEPEREPGTGVPVPAKA
ncbi:MAG: MFS transporter, partial [Vicinamibacterales bacterium]